MPDLLTGTDAQMWISNASVADTVDTSAEFAALTWVAIGLIESIGEYGDESAEITGNVINEGRTRRAKGTRNAGMQVLTCFHDDDDVGQVALRAAQLTSNRYGFKISPRDRLSGGGTDSIAYYRGLVMSARKGALSSDALQRITFNVGIDSAIIDVAAT
jgi:hypothetical protein